MGILNLQSSKLGQDHSGLQPAAQRRKAESTSTAFVDNRPQAVYQRKMQGLADQISDSPEAVQLRAKADHFASQQFTLQRKPNNTGLPDQLKSGIEGMSGFSMDDVKVHYNSAKPSQLQAHAYTQGTDIHVAPGQEQHIPHEAWHVVQQKQGRVQPTMQMNGQNINDDRGLEKEADVMGAKSMQMKFAEPELAQGGLSSENVQLKSGGHESGCGCDKCSGESTQLKAVSEESTQLKSASGEVAQLTCDHGHKNHPNGPCPVKDQAAWNAKRAGQSHQQHGGDAKGRAKMYERRKKGGK